VINPSWLNIVLIVLGLTAVIMLHEFGHFWTAKRAGMKVTEFFVGFGPRVFSFRRGETEYGIKALPLGGYVRIVGMNNMEEVDPADEARTYRAATTPRKLVVILAGVTVNVMLAYVCIAAVLIGQGVPIGTQPVLGDVVAESPAAQAGLQKGDRIVSVNGASVTEFSDLPAAIQSASDVPINIVYSRNGEQQQVAITPTFDDGGVPRIGVRGGGEYIYEQYSVPAALGKTVQVMWDTSGRMVTGLGRMVTPSFLRDYANTVSSGNASDPERPRTVVGIATETNRAMEQDPWALLSMLGALNLFLAIFNLIPLLPFDGGHAVIAAYEGVASRIARRKVVVDYRRMTPIAAGVFIVLLIISVPALVLDISQIFG
jgi:membrane-associated protease RseP (regulator of RpoE activity)